MNVSNAELLLIVDTVAREKNIDPEDVFIAIEQAIQKAGRTRYGTEQDIRAHIDRKSGEMSLGRYREIVDIVENNITQLSLDEALSIKEDYKAGDFIIDPLPPVAFGRIAAQTAKQVMVYQVREAEREKQYNEYKDRVGEVLSGIVKRIEYGHVIIDLGRGEGMMRRDEIIPRELFRVGDRVSCYFYEARREERGPQLFFSRAHPQFMVRLFEQEVPEISEGVITIHNCARDPGSRAKISVHSKDPSIDPVGACVGMRGSRVQAVISELQGEKVDIIPWSPDTATHIVNALAPAEVAKVVLDEENKFVEIIVPEDQLSQAIGRRGQNVRLASMLVGVEIDIMTEEQDQERRQKMFEERSKMLIEALDVDEVIARLLIGEGIESIKEIAEADVDWILEVEGFDEKIAIELIDRSKKWLGAEEKRIVEKLKTMKMDEKLIDLWSFSSHILLKLGEEGILRLEDLADLAAYELTNSNDSLIKGDGLEEKEATEIIMQARVKMGIMTKEEAEEILSESQKTPSDSEEDVAEAAEAVKS